MAELKYIVSKLKQAKDSGIELEEEEIRRTSGGLNIITFMIHVILSGLLVYKSFLSMSVSKVTSELCLNLCLETDEKAVVFNALFKTICTKTAWWQQTCVTDFADQINHNALWLSWPQIIYTVIFPLGMEETWVK